MYSITLKGNGYELETRLNQIPWVTHATVVQHNGTSVWQVSVSNEAAAEKDLLRYVLGDSTVTVSAFSRKKYELEQVFMDIVKGAGNVR